MTHSSFLEKLRWRTRITDETTYIFTNEPVYHWPTIKKTAKNLLNLFDSKMSEKIWFSKSIGINFLVWKLFVDKSLSTLFHDMCPFIHLRRIWSIQNVSWFFFFVFRIPPIDAVSELNKNILYWKSKKWILTLSYEKHPSSIFHRFRNFSTVAQPIRTSFSVSPKSTLWLSPPSPPHSLHEALTTVSSCLNKFVCLTQI